LASLAIEVMEKYDIGIIDSWYILPYGIAGLLVKNILKKPQILRRAGSDITRLFNSPYLNALFLNLFKQVEKIVTYPIVKQIFLELGIDETKLFLNKISVDTSAFDPHVKPFDLADYIGNETVPIITYIGKISESKGIFELVRALSRIRKENFRLLLGRRWERK